MAAAGIQRRLRGLAIALGGFHHDGNLSLNQLGVGRFDVDHQVAVHLAQADHRGGRDHVERHLLARAGLEAGGPGQHLGPVDQLDGDVGVPTAPHLSCVGSTRENIREILQEYKAAGIRRIEAATKDSHVAILRDDTRIPVSKAGYQKLKLLVG